MFSRNILDQRRKTLFCMSLLIVYLNPISTRREGQILPTICRGCTKNFCSHTFLDIQSYNGAIKFHTSLNPLAEILTSNSVGTQLLFLGCNQVNIGGSNFITKKKICLVPPEKEISNHIN